MNEDTFKRHCAMQWWNKLTLEDKFFKLLRYFPANRVPSSLTGREIESIWSKEHN